MHTYIKGVYTLVDLKSITTMLEPMFIKHGVIKAIVFGSYARGEATDDSDIDMVIDSKGFLRGINFFTAQYEIAKVIPIKSDIYEQREIKKGSFLENEILRDGVVVYER
jgi:predicted nucleotidyltransferase